VLVPVPNNQGLQNDKERQFYLARDMRSGHANHPSAINDTREGSIGHKLLIFRFFFMSSWEPVSSTEFIQSPWPKMSDTLQTKAGVATR
jgi:hypothetical protein